MAHLENAGKRDTRRTEYRSITTKAKMAWSKPERWAPIIIVVVFFSVWEFLAQTDRIYTLFFPAPTSIAATLAEMIRSGKMAEDFVPTVRRMFSGFAIGAGAGLIVGLSMGWSSRLRAALDPIVAAIHPIPKISLLPIILIIFGFGELSRVVMVSISAFFPMLINSMAGVTQINPTYFEVTKNYKASQWKVFRRVVLPGSLPLVLSGARLALTLALTITIVIEIRFANEGLGTVIWLSWETLRTTHLYAVVAVLSVLGMSINFALLWLKKVLVPWHEDKRV